MLKKFFATLLFIFASLPGFLECQAKDLKQILVIGNSLMYHGPAPEIGW